MKLKGKHIFITGGAQRLGRAVSERLLQEEIVLSSTYRTSIDLSENLVAYGCTIGKSIFTVKMDLRDLSQITSAVTLAVKKFGPVDILLNCASDFYPTPVLEVSKNQWDALQETNLRGQFFVAQACAKEMLKKGGLIINFGDTNGEHPLKIGRASCRERVCQYV